MIGKRISRRVFLKYCASMASALALPAGMTNSFADKLVRAGRPSVIWLSFQECTGCTESLARAHEPTLEDLIFNFISLDYHHTLQAASGVQAEAAREAALKEQSGKYLLVVDGSIPLGMNGACSTIAGRTNLDILQECVDGAAAVVAIGTCAAFGGLPAAHPNPTGAVGVADLMRDGRITKRDLVNISGCPPVPIVISSVLAHFVAFKQLPKRDELGRPLAFYGSTVHEKCSRYRFFEQEKFAKSFDDEGARQGWCLYELGCKGPVARNACATLKWNNGVSFPVESGHPCIGCSEPGFWDKDPFYRSLDHTTIATKETVSDSTNHKVNGKDIYDNNCIYCHSPDAKELSTDPAGVVDVLRSADVRAHQRIELSDTDLHALDDYLKSLR